MQNLNFTQYRSIRSRLSKEYTSVNNLLHKKANILIAGNAQTIQCSFRQFYQRLKRADAYTAFGYGVSKHTHIRITTKKTGKADNISYITRSKEYYQFPDGPGIIMLDFDYSDYCPYQMTPKKYLRILKKIHPALAKCAIIVRQSVSAGVYGKCLPKKSKGFHVYIPILDASDSVRFGKLLYEFFWQLGYGYIALSKDGKMLERSPVDVAVFSPERLDFVGTPVVNPPLRYVAPKCGYRRGNFLDTSVLQNKNLDSNRVKELKDQAKKRIKREQKHVQDAYDHQQFNKYVEQGYAAKEALAIVNKNRANEYKMLDDSQLIYLCNGVVCMIKEAIEWGLFGEWMADPVEGVEYGTTTARLIKRHGQPLIQSFAHGGRNYRIVSTKEHSINVITGNPGVGKTYALCRKVCELYKSGQSICIALPTTNLMRQYTQELLKLGLSRTEVCSVSIDEDDIAVGKQLSDAIRAPKRLILITHACLQLMKSDVFKRMSSYHLFIDEVFFPAPNIKQYDLKHSIAKGGILKQLCSWEPVDSVLDTHILVAKKSKSGAINTQLNKQDDQDALSTEVTNEVMNAVKDNSKIVIISKMPRSEQGNYCIGALFNCTNLKYFKSCTIASAFVKETALYHWCERYFNMVDVTADYADSFRDLSHRLKKLTVIPFCNDRYSKHYRKLVSFVNLKGGKAISVQQYVNRIIKGCDHFGSETLRVLNNDDFVSLDEFEDVLVSGHCIQGERISSQVHGLNQFQHINSAVIVAAFNLRSFQSAFIKKLLPFYDPWLEHNALTTIQCFMRTSLRNPEATSPVFVMVPDKRTCDAIINLYDQLPKEGQHCLVNEYEVNSQ